MLAQLARIFELWMLGLKWYRRTDKGALYYRKRRVGWYNSKPGDDCESWQYFYKAFDGDQILVQGDMTFKNDEQFFDADPVDIVEEKVEKAVRDHFKIPDITKDL